MDMDIENGHCLQWNFRDNYDTSPCLVVYSENSPAKLNKIYRTGH